MMSAKFEPKDDRKGTNVRSSEDIKELAALARLISYAKYAAEDVELVGAMHWLELAMQAVNRELLESPEAEALAQYAGAMMGSRSTH
jgi:hypothetical protein